MLNSLAFGRQIALRMILLQLATAVLMALVFLPQGRSQAMAAAMGACLVALGTALSSVRTFSGLAGAGTMLGRLLAGMLLRWIVVLGGEGVILIQYKLPPLAAVTGLVAAYAVNLLALRFKG